MQAKLEIEWSPEQIAAWLRRSFPERPTWHVCHESIYQALYHGGHGGLSRRLTAKLRTGRPLRKRRRRSMERSPRFIRPASLIDQRPQVVEERSRIGDWEGDLIVGRASRSAIGTLVDRHSRYVKLVHLPGRHDALSVVSALKLSLGELPPQARRTLTWDQGSEMALHDEIADLLSDGVFFAFPGSPWQRPTNENTNGLIRQYLPKGADLGRFDLHDLQHVEDRLNNRPRKTLGWRTPAEVIGSHLRS